MHPNALQVDPKIVRRDGQFRADSDTAETTFAEMEADDIATLHQQFVQGCGGKLPTSAEVAAALSDTPQARVQKENTYAVTKQYIVAGKTLSQIAIERAMAESTILSHIEKLYEEKEITDEQLRGIADGMGMSHDDITVIEKAIQKVGAETLKPIYEELDGNYDYPMIRLVRALVS
jgi:hypothetical protein